MQDELHDLHSSPNRLLLGHVAVAGGKKNAQRGLMGKLTENRSLGRPMRTWDDNIKMNK